MMRLSVTHLDSFQYWRGQESLTLDHLLTELRGEVAPTPAMLASRAFHKVLEDVPAGLLDGRVIKDGYVFDFSGLKDGVATFDGVVTLPNCRELKVEREIATPSGPVVLAGKVDALTGLTVSDWKLTERVDMEKYADSWQWRAYLWMLEAERFEYHAFLAKYSAKDPNVVAIAGYEVFPLYTYASIGADVTQVVGDLARTVKGRLPET
jgi:hypothetical protein